MIKRLSTVLPILATVFCAGAAHADDAPYGNTAQEKKAVKESMAEIETSLAAAKKACGNSAISVTVDWSGYKAIDKQLVADSGRTPQNIYGLVGGLVSEGLDGLKEACSDPDFKKAAASLKTWRATPRYDKKATSSNAQAYSLSGTQVNQAFHPMMSTGGGAGAELKKVLVSPTSSAPWGKTVEETKAVNESMATIQKALSAAKKACGNSSMTVSVDWKAYGSFEDKLASETDRTKKNIYSLAGDLVSEGLEGLRDACGKDVEYKKAAAKLTSWSAKPKYAKGATSSNAQSYKKSGTTMNATFHPAMSTGGGAGELVRNAL